MQDTQRKGDWIGTYTGLQFWPFDPQPEDVCIDDIAHALNQICRFNGHTKEYYSVAQHCLNVERYLNNQGYNKKIRLYGLLHDASEAYICDIPSPVKKYLYQYKIIENNIMSAIYNHFNIPLPSEKEEQIIKDADKYILALEAKRLMAKTQNWQLVDTDPKDKIFTFDNITGGSTELIASFYMLRVTQLLP